MKIIDKIMAGFHKLAMKLESFSGILICVLGLLVIANILLRVLFKSPIFGSYEISRFISAFLACFGLASCGLRDGHISIDLLMEKFSDKTNKILYLVMNGFSFLVFLVVTWTTWTYAYKSFLSGEVSDTLHVPLYYPYGIIALGFLMLTLSMLYNCIKAKKDLSQL